MRRIFLVGHHPGFRTALAQTIRDQSQHTLSVAGDSCWDPGAVAAISSVQPDVVVLVVGFEASSELGAVSEIRRLAPTCQVLVIDALGNTPGWSAGGWGQADALLHSEQLATALVPTICRLVAQRGAAASAVGGTCSPPATSE